MVAAAACAAMLMLMPGALHCPALHCAALQVGLLGPDGADLPLHLEGGGALGTSTVLRCDAESNTFTFTDVPVRKERQWMCMVMHKEACAAWETPGWSAAYMSL